MKKSSLVVILILSLLGNAFLACRWFARQHPTAAGSIPVMALVEPPGAGKRSPRLVTEAEEPTTKEVQEALRAAGYPTDVTYAILKGLILAKYEAAAIKVLYPEDRPRWRRTMGPSQEHEATETFRTIIQQREREILAELGPPPAMGLSQIELRKKYGGLSPDKVSRVEAIEHDYTVIRARAEHGSEKYALGAKTVETIERERLADLAGILSKEELTDYFRYNHPAAHRLQTVLAGVKIDQQTYETLADFEIAGDSAAGPSGPADNLARRATKFHEVLGDADFVRVIGALDPGFGATEKALAEKSGLGEDARAKLFVAAAHVMAEFHRAVPENRKAVAAAGYEKLIRGLTPPQIEIVNLTPLGRMLRGAQ